MSNYLDLLRLYDITPNFWCSQEYINRGEFIEEFQDGYSFLIPTDETDWIIAPPINQNGKLLKESKSWAKKVWSDFPGWVLPGLTTAEFLDFEFIYDPKEFLHMDGKKWRVFRKNSRKFPARFGGKLIYDWVSNYHSIFHPVRLNEGIEVLLTSWLENKSEEREIHDDSVMMKYLFHGQNRKILFNHRSGEIYGINTWDINHRYVNFRFCISVPEKFSNEHMRLLFYTDRTIQNQGKLVNDGGCLGSDSLRKFKEKLNPIHIREVRSWKQINLGV